MRLRWDEISFCYQINMYTFSIIFCTDLPLLPYSNQSMPQTAIVFKIMWWRGDNRKWSDTQIHDVCRSIDIEKWKTSGKTKRQSLPEAQSTPQPTVQRPAKPPPEQWSLWRVQSIQREVEMFGLDTGRKFFEIFIESAFTCWCIGKNNENN